MRMHDVFHVSQLKEFKESSSFGDREIPVVCTYMPAHTEKDWYTVSEFLDVRKRGTALSYRVRWEGFEEAQYDTWEPAKLLKRDLGAKTFKAFVDAYEKTAPRVQQQQRRGTRANG
jgi:hypothetical protein